MSAIQRIFRYMGPYKWVVIGGLITTILPVLMELVVPRMLQVIVDQGIRQTEMAPIWRGAGIMLAAALVGAIATLGQGVFRAQLSQGLAFDIRNDLFSHIQSLSFSDLDKLQTGQLMTRVSSDVDVVRMFSSAGLALMLRAVLMILGSMAMMFLTDWQLSMIVIGFLAAAAVAIWLFMRVAQPLFVLVQQRLAGLNTVVQENLAGVQVVKAFVRERFEIGRFEERNVTLMEQNIRVGRILALVMPTLAILTNLGIAAVIWLGGLEALDPAGRLTIGELIAFNNYLMIGMAPLLLLGNMVNMASRAEASAARILEVLDTRPAIQKVANPYRPQTLRGQVTFETVGFRYAEEAMMEASTNNGMGNGAGDLSNGSGHMVDRTVLGGVDFTVQPGQRVALLGATGAGKSTLMHLIARFYDVTGGRILVDGVDVREWDPAVLRDRIGTVMQDTLLFSGTVRENIAYGRPNASLEEVEAAAKIAQAHDFIRAMPAGYESRIEARGANLSGGQKQRVAIARALLVNPGILILDDSTSAVDVDTEARIQDELNLKMAHTTTFIVAQRISSVLNADQILVLDGGHVVAQGNHRQLLQNSPIYQDIYRSQFGEGSGG